MTQPTDKSPQEQIAIYLSHLDGLLRRGCQVREALLTDSANGLAIVAARAWEEDCGVTINQLSGGSKSHWLARTFSEAFLMRSASGQAVEGAAPAEIVQRLLNVLEQAVATLSRMNDEPIISAPSDPAPRRFEFVHNAELRPVLEQAYTDSRRALEDGDYDAALRNSCGVLEAIVTDALEHKGLSALVASGAPGGKIAEWSFETRLGVAEKAGLIRGGCARLTEAALAYRDHGEEGSSVSVPERDARRAGQVLHVVMRDLNPGR